VATQMLERVLEVEVMDTAAEAHDYDSMDHLAVNQLFVSDFLAMWDGRCPILDLGTGTAQIPVALCQATKSARVVGVDLASHMLELGRENVRRAKLEDRVTLQRADAKNLPFTAGSYAAVISNSIVHHIPEPARVIKEMVRVLLPGGTLLVRDLLRPSDEPTLQHLVKSYAGDANADQQKLFADSLHAALTLAEIRKLVEAAGLPPKSVEQTSDRHWTWIIRP
jgi:ubiquinone/menaquinone biosynthesis C-methylase UbiE